MIDICCLAFLNVYVHSLLHVHVFLFPCNFHFFLHLFVNNILYITVLYLSMVGLPFQEILSDYLQICVPLSWGCWIIKLDIYFPMLPLHILTRSAHCRVLQHDEVLKFSLIYWVSIKLCYIWWMYCIHSVVWHRIKFCLIIKSANTSIDKKL